MICLDFHDFTALEDGCKSRKYSVGCSYVEETASLTVFPASSVDCVETIYLPVVSYQCILPPFQIPNIFLN